MVDLLVQYLNRLKSNCVFNVPPYATSDAIAKTFSYISVKPTSTPSDLISSRWSSFGLKALGNYPITVVAVITSLSSDDGPAKVTALTAFAVEPELDGTLPYTVI